MFGKIEDFDKFVSENYHSQINYYWTSASKNKKNYRVYRVLPIFLGAFLTFTTAISSTDYIAKNEIYRAVFAIGTPLLAVLLTITNELSKITNWSINWRDSNLTALRLEKELNRFLTTKVDEREYQKELEKIYDITSKEAKEFFNRTTSDNTLNEKQDK
jgi:hypothetical protein